MPCKLFLFFFGKMLNHFIFYLVDGNWGKWSDFGECSKSCGGGTKERTRTCDSPKPQHGGKDCKGSSTNEMKCNTMSY